MTLLGYRGWTVKELENAIPLFRHVNGYELYQVGDSFLVSQGCIAVACFNSEAEARRYLKTL